ncbi:BMP family protein [Caldicellulosiruptoraceae bacterium PP1]
MKKSLLKIIGIILIFATLFSLAACKKKTTNQEEGSKVPKTTEKQTAPEFKVGLVTDVGGVNDKGFNQLAYEGMKRAEKELGVKTTLIQSKQMTDYVPNLSKLAEQKYDLVIAVGFLMHDAVVEVAGKYPNTKFLIIDSDITDKSNVTSAMFKTEQCGYLAGIASAELEKAKFGKTTGKNVFGVVGGMKIPPVDTFIAGYKAAVLSEIPNAKVIIKYTGKFDDPATGKQVALSEISDGADFVFQVAGQTGLGVIKAAEEKGVYAIGVDADQNYVSPKTVITSAVKKVDVATYTVIKDTKEGNFKSGIVYFDLSNDGVGLAPFMEGVPKEVVDKVNSVAEDIKAGKITIPTEVKEK